MVGITIFLLTIVTVHTHQTNIYKKIERQEEMLFYEEIMSVTDTLMLSEGYPQNWNSSNVQVIGLASTPNNLNKTKVQRFLGLDYEKVKSGLGFGNKEFYFEMRNKTGIIGSVGNKDYNNSKTINTVNREGLMDGKKIKLSIIVWDRNE
ncbi:MAG: hypothetical protein ABEK36_01270 [Candidatus Aenigmatarchaeota archaeon]